MGSGESWKIFLKPNRCINCHACEIACEKTHGGIGHITVLNTPVFCRHCEIPPCVTSCYRDAIEMVNERVILRKDRCTNCGVCVFSCPFGAIMVKEVERNGFKIPLVHKCDGCIERSRVNDRPVCSATCPSGAIEWKGIYEALRRIRLKAGNVYLLERL